MADQIYSMCWPPDDGSPSCQADLEPAIAIQPAQRSNTSGTLLNVNHHDLVPMATDENPPNQKGSFKQPGFCVNGKPVSLNHLSQHGLNIEVPHGMVLAGAKSPLLGKAIIVTAVDRRFLPTDDSTPTVLGFSGCCVGCGEANFRYFTEFASHINLLLATQPKKQKHLKFYIVKDSMGRLCRGPRIMWRSSVSENPRKRTYTFSTCDQSSMDSAITPKISEVYPIQRHPIREGRSSTSSPSSCDSGSSRDPSFTPPMLKRSREEETTFTGHHAWLEEVCGVRPVLILGYPIVPPHFITSYKDIIVSDMLFDCFNFLKRPVAVGRNQHSRAAFNHPVEITRSVQSPSGYSSPQLSVNVVIILIAQYLSTLPENATISKEEIHQLFQNSKELFWQTHQENSTIQPFFLAIDSTNLVHFTSVATLPSKGAVKLVSSVLSIDDAVRKGLGFLFQISKHNQNREIKLQVPHYLLLVSSPASQTPEFCILVTGVNQSKLIQERLANEQSSLLTTVQLDNHVCSLNRAYNMVNNAIDDLMKQVDETMAKTQRIFLPFNGSSMVKTTRKEALLMIPKLTRDFSFRYNEHKLNSPQVASANHLLSCVLTSKDGAPAYELRHFTSVEFHIVLPPARSYFHQVLHQVHRSNILIELGLSPPTQSSNSGFSSDRIVTNDGSEETRQKMKDFLSSGKSRPDVLFVLVCDEAHLYFTPEIATSLPSFQELSRLPNTLILLVTPVPYLFQTSESRIRPDNEVFWSDPGEFVVSSSASDENLLNGDDNLVHFGMPEYIETLSWTHQIPLIREDDEFELMVLRANCLSTVPSNIVRCYVLVHHYTTAIMWAAGLRSVEPHCTFKTLQVVRDIIEYPLLNTAGRGSMLVIRIPNQVLALWAYGKLKDIRDRVGLQYRFAIIFDDGESDLKIEENFLLRLRVWRSVQVEDAASESDWYPTCYEDLLDLPCMVVVSGKERSNDTFPRSLKYCDFRLLEETCSYRSSLELEFNPVSRYINSGLGSSFQASHHNDYSCTERANHDDHGGSEAETDRRNRFCSNYPLPVLLVSRAAYSVLKKDFFGCPKNLSLPPDPATTWNNDQRPALVSGMTSEQSKYYRHWTKPRDSYSRMGKENTLLDTSPMKFYPACFLFSGPPQVGKLPAVLHFIQLLHNTLQKLQRVDVYDEFPESLSNHSDIPSSEMDMPNFKILSKIPFHSDLLGSRFSTLSTIHSSSRECDVSNSVMREDTTHDVMPTSSVMMSSFPSYDSYHHCEDCKNYREGLGASVFTKHTLTLGTGEQLTFVIPGTRRNWFIFNEQGELVSLKLPIVTRASNTDGWKSALGMHGEHVVNTPVFMPSLRRPEQGLLNLYHAMEGREVVHLTVVKQIEVTSYQKAWPNHVIVGLPPMCNYDGLGMIKDVIKEFATQNLLLEQERHKHVSKNMVWPFIFILDDSCVMWQNCNVKYFKSMNEHESNKLSDWSLLRTMQLVESSPSITSYALIGFNLWGTNERKFKENSYSICHVFSSVFLNISTTHHVSYNRRLFSWEQVDFNLKLNAHGGVVLRYNHLSVLTKNIPTGGGCHYDVTPHVENIISFPDRNPGHVIPIPAHFLLEEYFRIKSGTNVFPAANKNLRNPVLLLDCFINLGPHLTVDYRSTSGSVIEETGDKQYGGLLLYLCNGCHVTKEQLRGLRFCPGARICVISSDRSTLRDNVVKLDLEEYWRFRLRDEFKTAGSLGDCALFFLTGTYDG